MECARIVPSRVPTTYSLLTRKMPKSMPSTHAGSPFGFVTASLFVIYYNILSPEAAMGAMDSHPFMRLYEVSTSSPTLCLLNVSAEYAITHCQRFGSGSTLLPTAASTANPIVRACPCNLFATPSTAPLDFYSPAGGFSRAMVLPSPAPTLIGDLILVDISSMAFILCSFCAQPQVAYGKLLVGFEYELSIPYLIDPLYRSLGYAYHTPPALG